MTRKVSFKSIVKWVKGRAEFVDAIVEQMTDEETEKVTADLILTSVESMLKSFSRRSWVSALLSIAINRFRAKYNIPRYVSK